MRKRHLDFLVLGVGFGAQVLRRPSKKFLGNNREGASLLPEDDMQQASASLAKLQVRAMTAHSTGCVYGRKHRSSKLCV